MRDWRELAACQDEDPELFFPVGESGPAVQQQIAEAKAVCERCPVRRECLDFAMTTGQAAGIWGGLTEQERRSVRRRWVSSSPGVPDPDRRRVTDRRASPPVQPDRW